MNLIKKISCEKYQELPFNERIKHNHCIYCDMYYNTTICDCLVIENYKNIKELIKDLESKIGDYLSYKHYGYVETHCKCDRKANEVFMVKVGKVYGLYCKCCGTMIKWLSEREYELFKNAEVEVV